jgi:hypothetical protein
VQTFELALVCSREVELDVDTTISFEDCQHRVVLAIVHNIVTLVC